MTSRGDRIAAHRQDIKTGAKVCDGENKAEKQLDVRVPLFLSLSLSLPARQVMVSLH